MGFAPFGGVRAADALAEQWRFVHNAPETADDQRYDYHWRVLRAALEVTREQYGDYRLEPGQPMSEKLQVVEMQRPHGGLNTLVLDATQALEESLRPVKIPVDKGLLGYRVFLIQAEDQPRFAGVQSLAQLRQLRFGQQREWSDVAVYQAAGLPVVTGTSYEGLFHMLMLRRFDAFGRGVSEVSGELTHWRKKYPQMAIERELLLYYPLPVYFWFARTDEGRWRAQRVEEGMHALIADGTLDRLFTEEYAATIEQLGLDRRRTLRIANPHLSSNHPFDKPAYWFTPTP
ncbi:hypothetical protein [Pseudomonas sp. 1928-m]|uniref:hypothetical protein n=1 Tax=Pseudomonas sp. 1928-m TaxID=3033804 RepID=UPI0023DE6BB6|nr:hypothetical protein [Pseudomonas sp. 1928-m]MDF3193642.1 hypothetical protein [Pseudomonas sp. 1928-m]